jgi:hypothetical protein
MVRYLYIHTHIHIHLHIHIHIPTHIQFNTVAEGRIVQAPPCADDKLHLVICGLLIEKVDDLEVRAIKVGEIFVQRHAEVRTDGAHIDSDGKKHEVTCVCVCVCVCACKYACTCECMTYLMRMYVSSYMHTCHTMVVDTSLCGYDVYACIYFCMYVCTYTYLFTFYLLAIGSL